MSHTFYEDEQRRVHFEEWDQVLDDHLDTIHALNNGVDPHLDWVWDDREYMTLWELWVRLIRHQAEEFHRQLQKDLPKFLDVMREAFGKITDAARDAARQAIQWISDMVCDRPEHRERSLVPPPRVDARRVTHTSTKPPAPARIYRRRTP